MEEILASIRQIISEDGEGSDQGGGEQEAAGDDKTKELETAQATAPEVDDHKISEPVSEDVSEGSSGFDLSAEATAEPKRSSPALADIAANALVEDDPAADASGSRRSGFETMEPESSEEKETPDDLVHTGPYDNPFDTFTEKSRDAGSQDAGSQDADETVADAVASAPMSDDNVPDATEFQPVAKSEPAPEPKPAFDPPVAEEAVSNPNVETESPVMSAPAPKPVEYEKDDNLISPESGASVANAFSTLTHTILSQNARTLDDLVSDMLQPMLKDWLDENLPTLVERMVKQEIDRMARGGR